MNLTERNPTYPQVCGWATDMGYRLCNLECFQCMELMELEHGHTTNAMALWLRNKQIQIQCHKSVFFFFLHHNTQRSTGETSYILLLLRSTAAVCPRRSGCRAPCMTPDNSWRAPCWEGWGGMGIAPGFVSTAPTH